MRSYDPSFEVTWFLSYFQNIAPGCPSRFLVLSSYPVPELQSSVLLSKTVPNFDPKAGDHHLVSLSPCLDKMSSTQASRRARPAFFWPVPPWRLPVAKTTGPVSGNFKSIATESGSIFHSFFLSNFHFVSYLHIGFTDFMLYKEPMEHEKKVYQDKSVFLSSHSKAKKFSPLSHPNTFAPVSKNIQKQTY